MIRITAPVVKIGASRFLDVDFTDGVAEVESLHPVREQALIQHGYTVQVVDEGTQFSDLTVKELRDLAATEGVDVPKRARKPEIIAAFIRAGMESD